MTPFRQTDRTGRRLRLETLTQLRWFGVLGQIAAVAVTSGVLGLSIPLIPCAALIAASAALNLYLQNRYPESQRLTPRSGGLLLAFDVIQLSALLFLTGGLENPFAFLLLVSVIISANSLPSRITILLVVLVAFLATILAVYHLPFPLPADDPAQFPVLYRVGVWLALLFGLGFTAIYTWRTSEDDRRLSEAFTATELALARERHLQALDGLASAIAHALATPLSTIAVIAGEMAKTQGDKDPQADDAALLKAETQRCRDILAEMSSLNYDEKPAIFERVPLSLFVAEAAEPYRDVGIAVEIHSESDERSAEPIMLRNPTLAYSVANFIDNAVAFARHDVVLTAGWTQDTVQLTIADDGPGFARDILGRLGDPYVTSRSRKAGEEAAGLDGMGLGFFIAKTILERQGARLMAQNAQPPNTGAIVTITWPRTTFEAETIGSDDPDLTDGIEVSNETRLSAIRP